MGTIENLFYSFPFPLIHVRMEQGADENFNLERYVE